MESTIELIKEMAPDYLKGTLAFDQNDEFQAEVERVLNTNQEALRLFFEDLHNNGSPTDYLKATYFLERIFKSINQ